MGEGPSVPGLTAVQAAERLKAEGPNRLPKAKSVSPWRQLLAQMTHFFAAMLWVAGGLAIVAGMPQLGFAIFMVIVVNGLFAFTQEYRAERASEALRDLLPRQASVVRDGLPVTVDAAELVRGDLVILRPGDRISADMTVVEAHSLLLDLSTLTGESEPQAVSTDDTIWAGTFVVEGEGRGVVTHTG
ncbi:MAG: cation-transporting P-type ATPase, partial [Actinobacteria bacterium]|nr:cation-transporting P-type ATPase [Actinomycetota bacterium]